MTLRVPTSSVPFIIICAVLTAVTSLKDPDFYLHLMSGRYIVEAGLLPHTDPFSFTMQGQTWHIHEWLFGVLIYTTHLIGGEIGVLFIAALAGMVAMGILYRVGTRNGIRGSASLLIVCALMVLFVPFLTPRPQLITFLSYALFLAVLINFKYRGELKYAVAMPLVMVLWVNSHGAYLLGLAVLGLFIASEGLVWWYGDRDEQRGRKLKRLTWIGVATLAATLANPYFINHWLFPFELMSRDAMGVISEWQSPSFRDPFYQFYLAVCGLFFVHYIYLKRAPDLTELLLPGLMVAASFISARHTPLAVLTMLPFALISAKRDSAIKQRSVNFLHRILPAQTSRELGAKESIFNGLLITIIIVLLFVYSPLLQQRQQQAVNQLLPVEAVDYLIENGISGRFFNKYNYGGYLIYRLFPQQKVFIDIRADMYGDDFMRHYTTIYFGGKGWEGLFDSYEFDYVICDMGAPVTQLLLQRGDFWLAYSDAQHAVLLRKEKKG